MKQNKIEWIRITSRKMRLDNARAQESRSRYEWFEFECTQKNQMQCTCTLHKAYKTIIIVKKSRCNSLQLWLTFVGFFHYCGTQLTRDRKNLAKGNECHMMNNDFTKEKLFLERQRRANNICYFNKKYNSFHVVWWLLWFKVISLDWKGWSLSWNSFLFIFSFQNAPEICMQLHVE